MPVYRDHALLRLCNAGMMAVAIGPALVPIYLTAFSASLGGLDDIQLGSVAALLFAGFVAGVLPVGPAVQFVNAKPFALAGTGLSAVGLVLLSDAFSYHSLLASAFVTGVGAGMTSMAMGPIVSALALDDHGRALNRLHAFYCAGAVGTLAIAAALAYLEVSWRVVTIAFAAAPAGVFAGFGLEPVPSPAPRKKKHERPRALIRRPEFYLALAGMALAGAAESAMAQWLPAYAERALGFSAATGALALAGFAGAAATAWWLAARYAARIGAPGTVMAGAGWSAATFLAGAMLPVPGLALAACVLAGLGCGVLWPVFRAVAADAFPGSGAFLVTALAAAGNVGCLVAPFLFGYITEFNGFRLALAAAAVYPVILLGLLVLARRR